MNQSSRRAEYAISAFLWSRVKLFNVLGRSAISGYADIVYTIKEAAWGKGSDHRYEMMHALDLWLGLLDDTPRMGFVDGTNVTLDRYPELSKYLYTLQTEHVDLNKPYHETAYFLYERLRALHRPSVQETQGYIELLHILKAQSKPFNESVASGYIADLYKWTLLYRDKPAHAEAFGKKIYKKYDFLHALKRFGDPVVRSTHEAQYELAFFLWSRAKLVDSRDKNALNDYRYVTNLLYKSFAAGSLPGDTYGFLQYISVGLELLDDAPNIGKDLMAITDIDVFNIRLHIYDQRTAYVDIQRPILETARFFYEKIASLTTVPEDVELIRSFIAPLALLARSSDNAFEALLPGFLSRLLGYAEALVSGAVDSDALAMIQEDFPVLFSAIKKRTAYSGLD